MSSQYFKSHSMGTNPPSLFQLTGSGGTNINQNFIEGLLTPFRREDDVLIALINQNQTSINSNLALINENDERLDEIEPSVATIGADVTTHSIQIGMLETDIASNTQSISEKQNIISTDNKLPAALLDTSNSALRFVDVGYSIANTFQNQVMSIQNVQNQVTAQGNTSTSHSASIQSINDTNTLQTSQITDEVLTTTANISASISNVNNTSDANKPISTATQSVLNQKSSITYMWIRKTHHYKTRFQQIQTT